MSIERGRDLQPGDLAITTNTPKHPEREGLIVEVIRSFPRHDGAPGWLVHHPSFTYSPECRVVAKRSQLIPLGPPKTFKETRKEVAA